MSFEQPRPHDRQSVEQKIFESFKKHDMPGVYEQLRDLKSNESAQIFKKDLFQINADLQKSGILPDLKIVEDVSKKEGFSIRPQDKPPAPTAKEGGLHAARTDRTDAHRSQSGDRQNHSHPEGRHFGGGDHHRVHHHRDHYRRHHHYRAHHHRRLHHAKGGDRSAGQSGIESATESNIRGFADGAYDNVASPGEAVLESSVKTVLAEAKKIGLSPDSTRAAVAAMLIESKGNPNAIGDHGTSFGLFQLHRGGELTDALRDGRLKNASEAFDPAKNAHVALAHFKQLEGKYRDPGALAAAAQGPKHAEEYAARVRSLLSQSDQLIKKFGG